MEGGKGREMKGRPWQECNLFAVKCAEKSPPHDDDDGGSEGRSYSHEGRSETKGPRGRMKQVAFSIWTKAVAMHTDKKLQGVPCGLTQMCPPTFATYFKTC